jgi:hypothetical protein
VRGKFAFFAVKEAQYRRVLAVGVGVRTTIGVLGLT